MHGKFTPFQTFSAMLDRKVTISIKLSYKSVISESK